MNRILFLSVVLATLLKLSVAQFDPNYTDGHFGMIQLFDWKWDAIADECEQVLGPKQYGGVQVSPPNENRISLLPDGTRPWWDRYQPVSYVLGTVGGNDTQFRNMVIRCNAVGVKIYVDAIINHMCYHEGKGNGSAGNYFDADLGYFPAVPYSLEHFNENRCSHASGELGENWWNDPFRARNCRLWGLLDLNLGVDHVRERVATYLTYLLSLGVDGFRIDAAKHMWPGDMENIYGRLPLTNDGNKPYIAHEFPDSNNQAVRASEIFHLGDVTEFQFSPELTKNKNKIQYLETFGEFWGLMKESTAQTFMNNHDTQRSHGHSVTTFAEPFNLKILSAFMMAWPYGEPRVMSSFYFSHHDDGGPDASPGFASLNKCQNGWVCEHRWLPIANMAQFGAIAKGQPVQNWWTNYDNQIAFSRGNKAFLAINKSSYKMNQTLQTGLPGGQYCNMFKGNVQNSTCSGECMIVSEDGTSQILIEPDENPGVAIHTQSIASFCGAESKIDICTDCQCTTKIDCGYRGINEWECKQKGCQWCDQTAYRDPKCFYKFIPNSNLHPTCNVNDIDKVDCFKTSTSTNEDSCHELGCCWGGSDAEGIPWCYRPQ